MWRSNGGGFGLNGAGFRPPPLPCTALRSMARRLCRLSRLFPLVSSASASAAPRPHHLPFAVNPNPAPLAPSFSASSPPAFPAPHRLFSSASTPLRDSILLSSRTCPASISRGARGLTAVWVGCCRWFQHGGRRLRGLLQQHPFQGARYGADFLFSHFQTLLDAS